MTGNKVVKIGLLSTNTGTNAKIGSGIVASLKFVLEQEAVALARAGYEVEVLAHDDFGNSADAVRSALTLTHDGALCLVGPADSLAAQETLLALGNSDIPMLAPFATSTSLSNLGYQYFYRFTTPDSLRAERLINTVIEICGQEKLTVYALDGSPDTYAQSLRNDIEAVLSKRSISYQLHTFAPFTALDYPRDPKSPIIVCSPSAQGAALVKQLKSKSFNGPFFGFGSNTNYLNKDCTGMVLITDLHRDDFDPTRRKLVKDFFVRYPYETEPSLPTMAAARALVGYLSHCRTAGSIPSRAGLAAYLDEVPDGLSGPMTFTNQGEMVGNDLSVLVVDRGRRLPVEFRILIGTQLPSHSQRRETMARLSKRAWALIGFIAVLLGILQFFGVGFAVLSG